MDLPHDHQETVDDKQVGALLANELNQMSFKEREIVYEEIHAIQAAVVDETPEFVGHRLALMDEELQKIFQKPAYDQAERISKEYVSSRKLRLMFLRAVCFDAKKAAERVVTFFEWKLKLFGLGPLARSICYSDLDEDDQQTLRSGVNQLVARDRAGRIILGNFQALLSTGWYKRIENVIKSFLYVMLTITENDEETQKRGTVGLLYFVGSSPLNMDRDLQRGLASLLEFSPSRLSSIHMCVDDRYLVAFKPFIMAIMGRDRRVRLRIHDGTHTECKYSLMTFGIPVNSLPISNEGKLKTADHFKWIARRRLQEEHAETGQGIFQGIDLPGMNDVLLGSGKGSQYHSGNIQLRDLVALQADEYEDTTKRSEKTMIAKQIMMKAKELGGRFLKQNVNGWWMEISDNEAREKVSKTMRTHVYCKKKEGTEDAAQYLQTKDGKRARIQDRGSSNPCFALCPGT